MRANIHKEYAREGPTELVKGQNLDAGLLHGWPTWACPLAVRLKALRLTALLKAWHALHQP